MVKLRYVLGLRNVQFLRWEVSKAKFCNGKYGAELELQKGGGIQAKKPSVRGRGTLIFSGTMYTMHNYVRGIHN